ncbi:hypothetical protein [Streptomyces nitrosporeus]|uniref:hypothetical protein n=1 Tax=Streptomyces nitrosporeus TaxID=28894 RepID=UPI0039A17B6D
MITTSTPPNSALTPRIIATANDHAGSTAVRALRVLLPGTVDTTPPRPSTSPPPARPRFPPGR